ncbi:MAG: hypothetical protein ACHQ4H_06785 [Ktedonobacterales bacterium]
MGDSAPPARRSARRSARVRLQALRTGVTMFSVLAGLACYFFLAQLRLNDVLASVGGLVFALAVRVAAGSLLRDWLLAAARRQREHTQGHAPSDRQTPPDARPSAPK